MAAQERPILITGARGQLGWESARTLAPLGPVLALDSRQLDLGDPLVLRRTLRDLHPRLIVNCAAYTAVDKAESEPEQARAVNAQAPAVMAEEARRLGALLVHYSTDYVFDGSGATPWREDDPVAPLNVYGATKLEGEQAILASGCRHLIFRTSWVYGARGGNFLLTLRRLARERSELNIVDDQIGAPTWCRHLAEASTQALAQILSPARGPDRPEPWGLYHLCNGGETSWHGFAQAILELDPPPRLPALHPIPSSGYPTPARRPFNSRLNTDKFARVFGLHLPPWQDALRQCLEGMA